MILSGAQLTALRSHPGKMQFYLGVHDRASYCYCQVNNPSAARGDMTIPYDHASWGPNPDGGYYTFADVTPNVTCYLAASAWSDLGRVRVKNMDANNIYVAENEHLAWADDMWLTIAVVHQPWAIYPRVTAVDDVVMVYQDYDLPYVSLADANRPVPIMGPPVAGFLDGTPATFTAYFDGNNSYGLDGAHIDAWSWKFPGGTPATSAVATPGDVHWHGFGTFVVELTVTDSNGKSATGYRPVFVYSDRIPGVVSVYPYGDFEVNSLEGDDGGWRASFTVRQDPGLVFPYPVQLDPGCFRDDAEVVLFAEGKAGNGTALPIPGNDQKRASVLFFGYVVGETIVRDPDTSQVSFEVAGICGRMRLIEQFSDTLETVSAPAQWYEFDEGLTVDLAVLYHLRWRSTILEIADVYPTGKTAKRIMRQDFTQGDLHSQCQQLLDAIQAKMISDKQGSIYMRVDPQVLPSGAERNAVDSMFTMNDSTDWHEELTFERRKLSAAGLVDLAGVSYAGGLDPDTDIIPILSLAPGNTPMYEGSLIEKVDGLVLESQAQANQLSGDVLAWHNNEYPTIRIPMAGPWTPLDVAPPSWLTWTMALNATKRGIFWTAARFLIRSVSIQCSNEAGEATVDISVEKETDGADGIDGNYPPVEPEEPISPVPVAPPLPPVPPDPGPPTAGSWRKHVLCCTADGPFYTDNFVTGGGPDGVPDWTKYIDGMGADVDCKCLAFHPLTPESRHYVLTAANVYTRTSLTGAWSVILSEAAARALVGSGAAGFFQTMQTSPVAPSELYVIYESNTPHHAYCLKSTDLGGSWAASSIGGLSVFSYQSSELQIDQQTGQRMYIGYHGGGLGGWVLMRSDNGGATWTNMNHGTLAHIMQYCICHANKDILFVNDPATYGVIVYISTDGGTTLSEVADQGGWKPAVYSNSANKHVFNSQLTQPGLVRCASGSHIYKSLNYGVTWTRVAIVGGWTYLSIEVVPDAIEKLYLHSRSDGAAATQNEGATIYDKNGVGGTAVTGGMRDLTPIWTLE